MIYLIKSLGQVNSAKIGGIGDIMNSRMDKQFSAAAE